MSLGIGKKWARGMFGFRNAPPVWCQVCHQRPWRAEAMPSVTDVGYIFRAWCHGAFRRWTVGREVIKADSYTVLARALVAFFGFPLALAPILVAIRRLRGRRLPIPPQDRLTVWLAGAEPTT